MNCPQCPNCIILGTGPSLGVCVLIRSLSVPVSTTIKSSHLISFVPVPVPSPCQLKWQPGHRRVVCVVCCGRPNRCGNVVMPSRACLDYKFHRLRPPSFPLALSDVMLIKFPLFFPVPACVRVRVSVLCTEVNSIKLDPTQHDPFRWAQHSQLHTVGM